MGLLKRTIIAQEGNFIVEYALFTAFISALVFGAMGFIGAQSNRVTSILESIGQALQ